MFSSFQSVVSAVERGFGAPSILVVGDVMLDRYVWGRVDRISPEAPVPIVRLDHTTQAAGGAGNVALNVANLGCRVFLAGFTGIDSDREQLLAEFRRTGVDTSALVALQNRRTTVKTRVMGGHQQMLRLDAENVEPALESDLARLLAAIEAYLPAVSAIVLSDYAKGVLSPIVCRRLIEHGRRASVPVLVDPKGRDYTKYSGATAIAPNRAELAAATASPGDDIAALLREGEKLRSALALEFIALTLSEHGIALIEPAAVRQFPTLAREVFDVSGAGDTVIATLAAAISAGLSRSDAVQLANLAAGIVVGKVGTAGVSRHELIAQLTAERALQTSEKICGLEEVLTRVAAWRARGERIVFTNGCFDILHVGHVTLLQRARREGDRLVVGVNTDESVSRLKGPSRPIIGEEERSKVLAALSSVDAVILFDEPTPMALIHAIRPHVLVKGGDYTEDTVVGAKEVRSWGGKVVLVPLVEGFSTTDVLKKAALTSG
jgi:D-beta-D-heptose 7-phosphate kinase/D-beta-D-heptose 1-phosphate adenosyltransferase